MKQPEILVEKTRGDIIECIHHGDIAVVNAKGELLFEKGNPHTKTYIRSAAKPIQSMNVVLSGTYENYGFTPTEIAIMCASHYGENFHIQAIENILGKIGLSHNDLLCGTVTSLSTSYALELAARQIELNPMYSDCSGKQAGMLAVCQNASYDIKTYLNPEHPCQQEILEILSQMCVIEKGKIAIGIDGCSAPVHALPLYNMALGYAKLANPEELTPEYKHAASIIFESMNQSPEMVSGTNGFCSDLIRLTNGKLIGKVGAEGIYCIGVKDMNIGMAVKVRDGSMAVLPPIVIRMLEEFQILNDSEIEVLSKYRHMDNINDVKTVVGKIKPAF